MAAGNLGGWHGFCKYFLFLHILNTEEVDDTMLLHPVNELPARVPICAVAVVDVVASAPEKVLLRDSVRELLVEEVARRPSCVQRTQKRVCELTASGYMMLIARLSIPLPIEGYI